jgi:hypothetical protein
METPWVANTMHRVSPILAYLASFVVVSLVWSTPSAEAQFVGGIANRVVGGIRIDSQGMIRDAQLEDEQASLAKFREQILGGQQAFAEAANLRLISLNAVQKAMVAAARDKVALPEEIALLGGLTRVEYVFVYPESNDIVLGGPSENWTVAPSGAIVGMRSGRPIVLLEDLLVAFQAMSRPGNILSCSIDPTPEGTQKLNALLDGIRLGANANPSALEPSMKKAFGPQVVSLEGLAPTSHMAHVLVAADYQMKRLGMNLAKAPVKGLPSYVEMIRNKAVKAPQSRWWMACDYRPLQHSEDQLSWRLSGPGIKTLSEQEVIQADGRAQQTGKVEPVAQQWAELFTGKLEELSVQTPVFGELRNAMDLCVIAALIQSRDLAGLAHCDLSVLRGETKSLELPPLPTPRQLEPQCSFLKTAGGWVVTASGGVLVDAWSIVAQAESQPELAELHQRVKPNSDRWSWN